jgi:hypothetical protein
LLEMTNPSLDLLSLRVELLLELLFVIFELLLELLFERALPLLEQLNVPLDPPFERTLSQFEEALLSFKLLLEELQGWKRHLGPKATQ